MAFYNTLSITSTYASALQWSSELIAKSLLEVARACDDS